MKVTDKDYYMDEKLLAKLDLMCKRCSGNYNFDNWIIVDGNEGYGKSNLSLACAYYQAWKLKREFKYFFNLSNMLDYAKRTEEKVIVWDEGALGGLAQEHWNKTQRLLLKFSMVARKKRHIYWINVPKFYRLNEYLAVDRSIALIHVYSPDELQLGQYAYFNIKGKERLYFDLKRKKLKTYKNHYSFLGRFRKVMGLVVDEKEYDQKKEEAINSMGGDVVLDKDKIIRQERIRLLNQFKKNLPELTMKNLARGFDISERQIYRLLSKENPLT